MDGRALRHTKPHWGQIPLESILLVPNPIPRIVEPPGKPGFVPWGGSYTAACLEGVPFRLLAVSLSFLSLSLPALSLYGHSSSGEAGELNLGSPLCQLVGISWCGQSTGREADGLGPGPSCVYHSVVTKHVLLGSYYVPPSGKYQ